MAKKEMKTISVRIPVDMYDELTSGDRLFNPSLIEFYNNARKELDIKKMDIRGLFTPDEWKGLVSSMNGIMVNEFTKYNVDMLIAHNEDAEKYERSFSNFGVNLSELNGKIKNLTMIQISSIYDRINDYWNNKNGCGYNLDSWAEF